MSYIDPVSSPTTDEMIDRLLGIAAPETPEDVPEGDFEATGWQRFLEGFRQPQGRPRGFGQSFLSGLTGSLADQGSRIADKRQRFEAQQERRRVATDEARRKSTAEYRQQRATALKDLSKEQRAERTKASEYERDNRIPTPDQLREAPYLARMTDSNGRVPRATLEKAFTPEKAPRETRETGVEVIIGPDGQPINVRPSASIGKQPYIRAAEAAKTKPATGEQKQALAFYNRGKEALDNISAMDASGKSLEDRIAAVPAALGAFGQRAPNPLKGRDRQLYEQAQRAFTQAKLRKESGAAISATEYESDAQTYFAQPGDDPEVVAKKRVARDGVLQGLKFMAGPAYQEFYGDESAPAPTPAGTAQSRDRPPLSSFNR